MIQSNKEITIIIHVLFLSTISSISPSTRTSKASKTINTITKSYSQVATTENGVSNMTEILFIKSKGENNNDEMTTNKNRNVTKKDYDNATETMVLSDEFISNSGEEQSLFDKVKRRADTEEGRFAEYEPSELEYSNMGNDPVSEALQNQLEKLQNKDSNENLNDSPTRAQFSMNNNTENGQGQKESLARNSKCNKCEKQIINLHFYEADCDDCMKKCSKDQLHKNIPQINKPCPPCTCPHSQPTTTRSPTTTNARQPLKVTKRVKKIFTCKENKPKPPGQKLRANTEIPTLETELFLLRQELADIKEQNIEIKNIVTSILTNLNGTILDKQLDIKSLKSTMLNMKEQLAKQRQDNLKNEVEITGLSEKDNESLLQIVKVASKMIGVDLADADISDITRVNHQETRRKAKTDQDAPRPVVLTLVRTLKRDELVRAANLRHLMDTFKNTDNKKNNRILFNERLTKENQQLFREARLRTSVYNFSSCWASKGHIFVRQSSNSSILLISNLADLDKKVGPVKKSLTFRKRKQ